MVYTLVEVRVTTVFSKNLLFQHKRHLKIGEVLLYGETDNVKNVGRFKVFCGGIYGVFGDVSILSTLLAEVGDVTSLAIDD